MALRVGEHQQAGGRVSLVFTYKAIKKDLTDHLNIISKTLYLANWFSKDTGLLGSSAK